MSSLIDASHGTALGVLLFETVQFQYIGRCQCSSCPPPAAGTKMDMPCNSGFHHETGCMHGLQALNNHLQMQICQLANNPPSHSCELLLHLHAGVLQLQCLMIELPLNVISERIPLHRHVTQPA